jgi:hypothetical protein
MAQYAGMVTHPTLEVAMRHSLLPNWAATLLASLVVIAPPVSSQTAQRTPEQIKASFDAHQGDFDYLLGDWEFSAEDHQYGKLRGYWSALRLPEGALVLDEYRIVGDSGETYYMTNTMRAYNAVLDRWELISTEAGNGLQNFGTARREGGEMHIEQRFGVGSPNPSLWRIRYYNIGADHFSWVGDRSADDGKTWVTNYLKIEARRIGPPRTMGPLAPARKPSTTGS